jgi:L-2-hydroxyglutarate oxidase LhgO
MEDFAKQFLNGKIRFETEILNIRRGDHGRGWNVLLHDKSTGAEKVLYYSRIILCTGVSSAHILDPRLHIMIIRDVVSLAIRNY